MTRERRTMRRERDASPLDVKIDQVPAAEPVVRPSARGVPNLNAPAKVKAPVEQARHLDLSDLEAIAHMNLDDLASMMSASTSKKRADVGTKAVGTIVRIGTDSIFIDIGEKAEGMIAADDLPNAKIGDTVTAYVLASDEDGIHLSVKLSGDAASGFLEIAAQTGIPVEGRVASKNPGGYEIRFGSVRAFCPISHIDRNPDADPEKYVGQTFEFRVIEYGESDVVVSRRALLEAGLVERRQKFWETAKIGDEAKGVVVSAQPYGVFVDMDGVDGLVPKRELSWEGGDDPVTAYKRGQAISVRIIDLDHEARKITLSARDPSLSPWSRVGVDFVQGGTYEGVVAKVTVYGAFVDLAPGLSGLLHSSRGGKKAPKEGEKISVRITGVDNDRQRLELSASDAGERAPAEGKGAIVKAVVQQVLKNGLVVDVEDGNQGWIPANEIELPAGTILAQRFRVGKDVQARVVEHDASRRRVVLSLKLEAEEADSWRQNAKAAGGSPSGGLGTFAELLAGVKVNKKKK